VSKRKTRSQRQRTARQRAATPEAQRAVTTPPRKQRGPGDRMALYRSLASPGVVARVVFIVGLLLISLSQVAVTSPKNPPLPLQVSGVAGAVCVLGFIAAGMRRHFRAIYRIRRDDPGAWQPTMGFAFASLAVPLGLSGAVESARERLLRNLTLLLVLLYLVSTVVALNRQH
jgi:hypothetical protein